MWQWQCLHCSACHVMSKINCVLDPKTRSKHIAQNILYGVAIYGVWCDMYCTLCDQNYSFFLQIVWSIFKMSFIFFKSRRSIASKIIKHQKQLSVHCIISVFKTRVFNIWLQYEWKWTRNTWHVKSHFGKRWSRRRKLARRIFVYIWLLGSMHKKTFFSIDPSSQM